MEKRRQEVMPLEHVDSESAEQPDGVLLFPMSAGSRLISCSVTADALHHLTGRRHSAPLNAFAEIRPYIELLVSAKHEAGLTDPDGGVTIGSSDLVTAS